MRSTMLLLLLAGAARSASAEVVLNEVLYDPEGTDGDREFVELYNPADVAIGFEGLELWFINGADPEPRPVWRADTIDPLSARSFFVVGGSEVDPDVVANLGLQNGPDGLWLVRSGERIDAVAWGNLPLGEGDPAPDVSGTSLGRVPDGADTGDNQADFARLDAPTPGGANAVATRLAPVAYVLSPSWRHDSGTVRISIQAVASGTLELQEGPLHWILDGERAAEGWLRAARGDTARAGVDLWVGPGAHDVLAISPSDRPDTLKVPFQVGLSSVVLNEVMARPYPGQPEWIELRAVGPGPVDLMNWAVSDRSRKPRRLFESAILAAGELAVVSEDPAALREVFSIDPEVFCTTLGGGWPTLNNQPEISGEPADEVVLFDARGAVVDVLAYDESLTPDTGRGMERGLVTPGAAPLWFAAPGQPTPGSANVTWGAPVPAHGLETAPNPFTPDGDGLDDVLHIVLRDGPPLGVADAEIRHLAGDRVRALGPRPATGTVRQWIWDGRDASGRLVPIGAYLVVVRAADSATSREAAWWRSLVAVGRRR